MRYIYQGVFQDQSGNAISGGTITPYLTETSTAVSIYTEDEGAYALANSLKTVMNAHAADSTVHTTAIDDVNFPVTTADATTLATLLALTGALLTAYDVHDDDAELGAAWAYHIAQEGSDYTPTSVVTPTTLDQATTRLNDLKAKYNLHEADSTSHAVASQHTESTADSGTALNSVTSDSAGKWEFYVNTDDYSTSQLFDVTLSKTDFTPQTYKAVQLFTDGSVMSVVRRTVQTTDATETTLASFTLTDETTYHIEAYVVGVKSDGSARASAQLICTAYREGGNSAVIQGTNATSIHTRESDTNWAMNIDANSNDIRLRVTGVAATTVDWAGQIEYISVTPN